MDRQLPVWASVALVVVISAALLVSTHLVTRVFAPPEGSVGKDSAQGEAMPAAELFVPVEIPANSGLDNCYKGQAGGKTVGYAAQTTIKGYGGPIELVVGMDMNGMLTGISVDGAQFNESPGLGAKSKEPEFKNQFAGIATPVGLKKGGGDATSSATQTTDATSSATQTAAPGATAAADATSSATENGNWATQAPAADATSSATQAADATSSATQTAAPSTTAAPEATEAPAAASTIDAISGATITSTAVVNGVNQCAAFIKTLLAGGNA